MEQSKRIKIVNRIKGEQRVQKSYKIYESLSKELDKFAKDNNISENALVNEIIREFLSDDTKDIDNDESKPNSNTKSNSDKEVKKSNQKSNTQKVHKEVLKIGDIEFKVIDKFEYKNRVYYKLLDTNNKKVCKLFDNEKKTYQDITINTFTAQKSNSKKEKLANDKESVSE